MNACGIEEYSKSNKVKERKVYGFNMQFKSWLNQLSLLRDKSNKKIKTEKQNKKNQWAIKSGNGHKNLWDPSEKVRETMVGRIYGKVHFESEEELRCRRCRNEKIRDRFCNTAATSSCTT